MLKLKNDVIPVVLSTFSAILLIFSFAPFNLSFLAWFALIPLFSLLPARFRKAGGPSQKIPSNGKESSPRKIFTFYYLAGLVFWAYHIWWLVYVTFLGYCLLVIYLALFLGFFGLFLKLLTRKTEYPLVFIAPPLWVIFELARTYLFVSFPWSLLGYSQWRNIHLIQISSITGVYGVSFMIVMFNAAISDFIFANPVKNSSQFVKASKFFYGTKTKKQARNLLLALLIITAISIWGYVPSLDEECECRKIKISVVQGNIAQDIKWDEEYAENIVNIYAELSIYASIEKGISLIVWPETSYPDYVDIHSPLFQKVQSLTDYSSTPLLMGAVNRKSDRDYNSALLIMPDGKIDQIYNKIHLVPFAEYIPIKKFLFFLSDVFPQIGNFSEGKDYTIFEIRNLKSPLHVVLPPSLFSKENRGDKKENKGGQLPIPNNFATLICFEDLFPDLARRFTNKGANFLVVITNDAHFRESPALWQHFTHSVFRAVENRRPLIRAANNGISGFIDSYGRPIETLNENGRAVGVKGFATNQISPSYKKTFYTRFGDLFAYLNALYLVVLLIILAKKNIKKL
ncbi:MAG: apolipoprotein N-acyltransferase [Candidatus Omnitrophota bacterium]